MRARSSFYRARFASLSQAPLGSLSDLSQLPFTTEADLAERGPQLLCVSQDAISRVTTLPTSGTTGQPKSVYFTSADLELTVDFFGCGMSTMLERGQRVLVLMPGERSGTVGRLLKEALARLDVDCFVHGLVTDTDRALDALEVSGADTVVGLPVQILGLARHPRGRKLGEQQVRQVLLSADYVSPTLASAVVDAWGCRVFQHYGMTEMGLGGGVQCRAHGGYHLREADLYVEIIDPETGCLVRDGELGEVVFTALTRTGMPLIRYRTGDLSRMLREPCACGTCLPTLASVYGRTRGAVPIAGGGSVSMPDLDDILFALDPVLDFSAEVSTANGRDRLALQIFSAPDWEQQGLLAAVKRALATVPGLRGPKMAGLLEFAVEIVPAEVRLNPRSGKRRIVDLRVPGDLARVPHYIYKSPRLERMAPHE